jgi:hypothetical protein
MRCDVQEESERGIKAEPNIVAFTCIHNTGRAYHNWQALRNIPSNLRVDGKK